MFVAKSPTLMVQHTVHTRVSKERNPYKHTYINILKYYFDETTFLIIQTYYI